MFTFHWYLGTKPDQAEFVDKFLAFIFLKYLVPVELQSDSAEWAPAHVIMRSNLKYPLNTGVVHMYISNIQEVRISPCVCPYGSPNTSSVGKFTEPTSILCLCSISPNIMFTLLIHLVAFEK